MIDVSTIKGKLDWLYFEANLKLKDIAKEIGINRATLSRIKNGKECVGEKSAYRINKLYENERAKKEESSEQEKEEVGA